jgi:NTP pyrophosphatase (non-canonical NTP hydrolase)
MDTIPRVLARRIVIFVLFLTFGAAAQGAGGAQGATAVPAHDARVIASPHRGEVVRSNTAVLRVRVAKGAQLRATLNGVKIGGEFGPRRKGSRALRASISEGLRKGRNLLKVTVKNAAAQARRMAVRFQVEPPAPLLGAGRNEVAAVGGTIELDGKLASRADGADAHWTLVDAPRAGVEDAGKAASLTSPAGLGVDFRPRFPGRYTLRLDDRDGGVESTDFVVIDVLIRNKLVPIDTMIAPANEEGKAGIQVGNRHFLLSEAELRSSMYSWRLQVVVLNRKDLSFVSNRQYGDIEALRKDLASIGSEDLVIVAMQPSNAQLPDPPYAEGLDQVLGMIGAASYGKYLPREPGYLSIVGVKGWPRGTANVNVLPVDSPESARMVGYLTPDQHGGYGFVSSLRKPFSFGPTDPGKACEPGGDCQEECGFFVQDINSRTGGPGAQGEKFFSTCIGEPPIEAMAKMLEDIRDEDVVIVHPRGIHFEGESSYFPLVGRAGAPAMHRLAAAIAKVGGTRNAINQAARERGVLASGGMVYALVGWKGAPEGAGAEVAANVGSAGPTPALSGVLRPELESRMRPAELTAKAHGPDLSADLLKPPTTKWPLKGDPAEMDAFSYLGSTDNQLGRDPRAAYWIQSFAPTKWESLATKIKAETYESVPAAERAKFTKVQFEAARKELGDELDWVASVREYLSQLANPFDVNIFKGWREAKVVADKIRAEVEADNAQTGLYWTQFTSLLLNLAGPLTGNVTSTLGGLLEIGVWYFGGETNGEPTAVEYDVKADEVGTALSEEMEAAVETFSRMGDVIVTDPAKLKALGEAVDCLPTEASCNPELSFTTEQKRQVTADISRSIERYSYEKLLPLGFHTFQLNIPWYPPHWNGGPPPPREYQCSYYPWYYYSDTGIKYATSALLQESEPAGNNNIWQVLVLARPPKITTRWGTPPSDEILKRMFSPVPTGDNSETDNPKAGGLGMSPVELMSKSKWYRWDGTTNSEGKEVDECQFNEN